MESYKPIKDLLQCLLHAFQQDFEKGKKTLCPKHFAKTCWSVIIVGNDITEPNGSANVISHIIVISKTSHCVKRQGREYVGHYFVINVFVPSESASENIVPAQSVFFEAQNENSSKLYWPTVEVLWYLHPHLAVQ